MSLPKKLFKVISNRRPKRKHISDFTNFNFKTISMSLQAQNVQKKCSEIVHILKIEVKLSWIRFTHTKRTKKIFGGYLPNTFLVGDNFFRTDLLCGISLDRYSKNIGGMGATFFNLKLSLRNLTLIRSTSSNVGDFEKYQKNAQS